MEVFMGKSSINGSFSMAMLNNQMVSHVFTSIPLLIQISLLWYFFAVRPACFETCLLWDFFAMTFLCSDFFAVILCCVSSLLCLFFAVGLFWDVFDVLLPCETEVKYVSVNSNLSELTHNLPTLDTLLQIYVLTKTCIKKKHKWPI